MKENSKGCLFPGPGLSTTPPSISSGRHPQVRIEKFTPLKLVVYLCRVSAPRQLHHAGMWSGIPRALPPPPVCRRGGISLFFFGSSALSG